MRTPIPSLIDLEAFEAAARHGSFVAAAGELHLTASAISHRVRSLERQLGVVLFTRHARRIELTDHGRAYVPAVRQAFDDIMGAAIALGGTITGEHGVGAAKRPYLERRLGADQMALLRRLKAAFDPAGILNPGKLGS